ncbi:MAG: GNAT family N-acetyltransferase [Candidatus Bathyarchaeota archaeon]|nr:GNAT family N-acetyltransferase [Candidatus Bathyarchaeota archaeon]
MTEQEVALALDWARMEGWNPGVHDAACFYQADPTGFYAAKLDGEIVGTISLVKYSPDFCFEGLYIVKPEFRGRGIGRQIQKFALDACRTSNLGLDGVVSMQHRYEQYGFKFAYGNTRYAGTAQADVTDRCLPIKRQDVDSIYAYDRGVFGLDRSGFLGCWLMQSDAASMMVKDAPGGICGYGVIRKCTQGHKIGPLFADDAATADALFDGLAATVKGETIFLDTPQINDAAVALAEKKKMTAVFSTVRMYSKNQPDVPLNKVFGVTTFELG